MIGTGDVIENPVSRETFTFLQTSRDTRGALLQIDVRVQPGGAASGNLLHFHPRQTETFRVREGRIRMRIGSRETVYGPGAVIEVAPRTVHLWANASDDPLRFVLEFRPALEWERFFETVFAYAHMGVFKPDGKPPLLLMGLAFHRFKDHVYLPGIPIRVQRFLYAILAVVARLGGYRSELDYPATVSSLHR